MSNAIFLDVSHLPAPEPMTKILQQLATMKAGQFLAVSHRKEPVPLYDRLRMLGFAHLIHQRADDDFLILIYFPDDLSETAAQAEIAKLAANKRR